MTLAGVIKSSAGKALVSPGFRIREKTTVVILVNEKVERSDGSLGFPATNERDRTRWQPRLDTMSQP
jgi:hypothetical protein